MACDNCWNSLSTNRYSTVRIDIRPKYEKCICCFFFFWGVLGRLRRRGEVKVISWVFEWNWFLRWIRRRPLLWISMNILLLVGGLYSYHFIRVIWFRVWALWLYLLLSRSFIILIMNNKYNKKAENTSFLSDGLDGGPCLTIR